MFDKIETIKRGVDRGKSKFNKNSIHYYDEFFMRCYHYAIC